MTDPTPFTRPDVAMFLDFLNNSGNPQLHELPLADARASFIVMGALAETDPRPLPVIRDLSCAGPADDIPLRLYDTRETRDPGPVVLFLHGGGFVIGDLETHHALCTEIAAEMDLPVVAVHYRLAPEHPFPAAPDDCEAAARWVASSPAELRRGVTGIIPMGDSAGANLTLVVGQALRDNPAETPVVMQVPIYPATDESGDGSMREFAEGRLLTRDAMGWFMNNYAPAAGHARAYPANGGVTGSPPTVLVTAGLDPLRDQGRRYAAALAAAGGDVTFMEMQGSIHGFMNLRKAIPSAHADTRRILSAMKLMLQHISG